MSWQREDDGSLVYESNSFWRAVVYDVAGIFGAYVERPSERTISSPDSFNSLGEARAWCEAMLNKLDPPNTAQATFATYAPSPSRCPLCHEAVIPGNLQQHLQVFHPKPPKKRATPKRNPLLTLGPSKKGPLPLPATTQDVSRTCPICQKLLKTSEGVKSHMEAKHGGISGSGTRPSRSKPSSAPKAGNSLRPCPICQKLVQPDELTHHLRMQHGKRLEKAERFARSESSPRGARSSDNISLEALEQSYEDKRDASRGWGHHRRDYDGTWGSMPVHDDYGDESDAY